MKTSPTPGRPPDEQRVGGLTLVRHSPRHMELVSGGGSAPPVDLWLGVALAALSAVLLAFPELPVEARGVGVFCLAVALICLWSAGHSVEVDLTRVSARRVARYLWIPFVTELRLGEGLPETRVRKQVRTGGRDEHGGALDHPVYTPMLLGPGGSFALTPALRSDAEARGLCRSVDAFYNRLYLSPEERDRQVAAEASWSAPIADARPGQCPYCRDALDVDLVGCSGCETPYHAECALELGRCGTIGCAHNRPREQA